MSRYRVTVDQAAIAEGRPAINVLDKWSGLRANYDQVNLVGPVRVMQGEPQRDGARVWVDCEGVYWDGSR